MKAKYLIPLFFSIFFGCKKQLINELPNNYSVVKPVDNLEDSLGVVFSENGNAILNNPFLFSDTIQKNIVLTKESNVYVTFIDEGTDKRNSLCWYSYNKAQPPLTVYDINGNILFPNISKTGYGGLLETGYTLQLGSEKFPAGTVIGFFLVANGWKDGAIDYSLPSYYTDYNLNKGNGQMHILFKNAYSRYIIMGFEDNLNGTHDFNDVLFAVTDNNLGIEATSFDLAKVIVK
jgi:hypothetical protein